MPWIAEPIRPALIAYWGGIFRDVDSPMIAAGAVSDHAHLLFRHSKNRALAEIVEEVKKGSSKWIKTQSPEYRNFYWQGGYAAFSVSASRLGAVKRYVLSQEKHHKIVSFQDELRRFFKEYGVDHDEKYIWI